MLLYHLFRSHFLKTTDGREVICPILRAFTCTLCSATGPKAHTLTDCPLYRAQEADDFTKKEHSYALLEEMMVDTGFEETKQDFRDYEDYEVGYKEAAPDLVSIAAAQLAPLELDCEVVASDGDKMLQDWKDVDFVMMDEDNCEGLKAPTEEEKMLLEGEVKYTEKPWDGKSSELNLGLTFSTRNQVIEFINKYGTRKLCKMVVTRGGVSDGCKSRQV